MAVIEVIRECSRDMENILEASRKLTVRRMERMMIQDQTGRKAETRPRLAAL